MSTTNSTYRFEVRPGLKVAQLIDIIKSSGSLKANARMCFAVKSQDNEVSIALPVVSSFTCEDESGHSMIIEGTWHSSNPHSEKLHLNGKKFRMFYDDRDSGSVEVKL